MLYKLAALSGLIYAASGMSAGGTCCVAHRTEPNCDAEQGDECIWLDQGDPLLVKSQQLQCVSKTWIDCEVNKICPPPPPSGKPPIPPQFSCYFDACTASKIEINAGFLIDESGSVGKTNYLISLDFIENMVKHDINDVSTISMLAFASGLDRMYHFSDSQNDQRAGALAAITAERNNYVGGMTCTATAIREMVNEFVAQTDRTDNNIMFLMTDGYPNCGGEVCDERQSIDDAGIRVIVVGVSSGFNANKVACLVRDNSDIKTVAKFDPKLFYLMESQLRSVVCPVVYEEGMFAYIGGMLYNQNGYVSYWAILAVVVAAGLLYFYREKMCGDKGKYQPLLEQESAYGSTI